MIVPGSSYVMERWMVLPVPLTKAVDYYTADGTFLATRKLYLWQSPTVDPPRRCRARWPCGRRARS